MDVKSLLLDRVAAESWLIIACFASVLLLSSQSGASLLTYVLAIVVLASIRQWKDVGSSYLFWLIAVTLVYLPLTGFWAEPFSWRELASMAVRALLTFTFVVAFSEVQIRGIVGLWLRRGFVAIGLGTMLAAIGVYLWSDPQDGRLNGLGQLDTHVIAALVYGVVMVLALQVFLRDSRTWRLVGAAGLVVGAFAIIASDSRNAWFSVAIGLVVLMLAESTRDRQRFVASLAAVGLVLGVVALALFLDSDTRSLLMPRGTSFRPEIWREALLRIEAGNYWIGLGIYTPDDFLIDGVVFQHPHGLYIATLYQGGLIGLTLFLLLIGCVLSVLWQNYSNQDAKLGLGVLGVALPAFLLDGYELVDKIGSTWLLFWLPVAIALGLSWTRQLRER